MRRTIIAGNWKMHLTVSEAQLLARDIAEHVKNRENPLVIICAPCPYLSALNYEVSNSKVELGAQNVHFEKYGAFTGEVSDVMLSSVGCSYTIIGHSERRTLAGENDAVINRKVQRVFSGLLTPILCVGESLEERESGSTKKRIQQQVRDDLEGVDLVDGFDLIIAYEPVWAIGTGKTATPEQAQEVHCYIREMLIDLYDSDTAGEVSILYGGSVKPGNAADLLRQPDIDGALVGGASLEKQSFTAIIDAASP